MRKEWYYIGGLCFFVFLAFFFVNDPVYLSSKVYSYNPEVWFSSNLGALDMQSLFIQPNQWPNARAITEVYQFYLSQFSSPLLGSTVSACPLCGPNAALPGNNININNLLSWKYSGKKIAIETPVVKPNWCNNPLITPLNYALGITGSLNEPVYTSLLNTIPPNHPPRIHDFVDYLAIDEALEGGYISSSGFASCGYSVPQIVQIVSSFIQQINTNYPKIDIGLIEAYPNSELSSQNNAGQSVQRFISYIQQLEGQGIQIKFFHLDVNREAVSVYGLNIVNDITTLKNFITSRPYPIDFGVIMNANDLSGYLATTDQQYYTSAMSWASLVKNNPLMWPDDLIVQSFHLLPPHPALPASATLPSNLPETAQNTHTKLLNDIWNLFGGASPDLSPPTIPGIVSGNYSIKSNLAYYHFPISWQASIDDFGIGGYVLEVSNVPFTNPNINDIMRSYRLFETSYDFDPTLLFWPPPWQNSQSYYFRVRAFDTSGNFGLTTTPLVITVPPMTVSAPTNLVLTLNQNGRPQLNWVDNSNNEFNFFIDAHNPIDGTYNTFLVSPNLSSFTDESTKFNSGTYNYRIRAQGVWANSGFSNVASVTFL